MDIERENCARTPNKKVGKVTVLESNKLFSIFKHLSALEELEKIISINDEAYDRFQTDLQTTRQKFQQWWNEMSSAYKWETSKPGNWEINFDTCEIFIVSDIC